MGLDLDERAIFVRGPVVIFRWKNAPGWPVEYASPNVLEVFGHAADAFIRGEVAYADLIHPDDVARVASEVAAASESTATSFIHEPYRVRNRQGEVRWLYDFTHVQRAPDGEATHFLGYVIDITERMVAEAEARELERRLFHAQKLESLGLLAGGVAHDFNNLLTGILGQATIARRRLDSGVEGAREAVRQIEELTQRAADLTRQLLAYSGKSTFVVEPVEVGHVVRGLRGMIDVLLPSDATLELTLGAEVPPVMADRAQLQQVVMNLLTNAAEALGGGKGRVTVITRVESFDATALVELLGRGDLAPGPFVVLEVTDTGCGMDEDVARRLFDPFFTTKRAGRGLGMSAVQGIVRGHRGHIVVRSRPGEGTTFRVFLPATSVPVATPGVAEPAPQPAPSGQILVVDDEPTIRGVVQQILEQMGYGVITAPDGAAALAALEARREGVVLVLLDMTMPVMSGREVLQRLSSVAPRLPVIVTSGYAEEESALAASGANVVGFLPKPFSLEDVERTVREVLTTGRMTPTG